MDAAVTRRGSQLSGFPPARPSSYTNRPSPPVGTAAGYMDVGVGGVVLTAGLVSSAGLPYTSSAGGGDGGAASRWRPAPL